MQFFRPELKLDPSQLVRFRGNRGGIIAMHRALTSLRFGAAELFSSVLITCSMTAAWIMSLPAISVIWTNFFVLGLRLLPLHGKLKSSPHHVKAVNFSVPYLSFDPILPSSRLWGATCIAVLGIFLITFCLPSKLIPLVYLVRCVLFVQASALVYFVVSPAQFPYAPDDYLHGLFISGIALISIIPFLFALTYYIFPFSFVKKAAITLITMLYLAMFLPFQVILHTLILQNSILFMPTLYLVLGMPLDVLIVVSLYAWAMTWKFKQSRLDVAILHK